MKAALFSPMRYQGPSSGTGWPIPGTTYSVEAAEKSMRSALAQFRLADEVGFDWVTVAEHHYSPFSLNPNPMLTAGALTQIVRRAKIALLGSTIPILNPVRVAEEFAMIDTMSGGRVIAGMLRGTHGGLFITREDALRYALFENGRRPKAVVVVPGGLELDLAA